MNSQMAMDRNTEYFDAHIHLQDERFGYSWEPLWLEAKAEGLVGALCCSTAPGDWSAVTAIAARAPEIVPAYGVHPWFVHQLQEGWHETLIEKLRAGGCALGEVGLDGRFASAPLSRQMEQLERQLRLAAEFSLPVSLHCLDAWDALFEMSESLRGLSFALHAYSSVSHVDRLADLGAYFSFNGGLGRSAHSKMKKALCVCPRERILLETDAPDFPLVRDRGKPNVPATLPRIAALAACALGLDEWTLAETVMHNTRSYLGREC